MRRFLREYFRYVIPFLIVMGLMVVGTFGYMLIDNYRPIDAFFMTVITVSTVGYEEVNPLSDEGKLFTTFLIITSFATFAYAITTITKFVVDGELNLFFKKRKLNASLNKLKNHVIICGYGRNGSQAAQVLRSSRLPFIVVEKGDELFSGTEELVSGILIKGDATQDEVLLRAGVLKARALITTLPSDSANLFIVLTARNLNPNLLIISRASDDTSDRKLKIAGANNVIMPDKVGGAHMASLVTRPDVMEFLDFIIMHNTGEVSLEEIAIDRMSERWAEKTLGDVFKANTSGANIVGCKSPAGEFKINPGVTTPLNLYSHLFVLGRKEQIDWIRDLLHA